LIRGNVVQHSFNKVGRSNAALDHSVPN
jgi:hypothetical protein